MHGIIISPMIYNVKRIYICLSDIFKLFQDFFKRNSGNHSSPHQFPHNPTFYDKMLHKEKNDISTMLYPFFVPVSYIDEAHAARITLHVFSCKLCLSIMRHDAIYMFFL